MVYIFPLGGTIYLHDVGFAYHMVRAVQSLVMVNEQDSRLFCVRWGEGKYNKINTLP